MESLTYLKNIKIAPKKMRFLLSAIKKMAPAQAVQYLFYSSEKTARIYYKAINSAISNAKNTLKVSDDVLEFKLLTVEEGQKLKRFRPNARGTARPFIKRYSHIKIILTAQEAKPVKQVAKVEKVKETKEVVKKETKTKEIKAKTTVKKDIKSEVKNKKS